MAKKAARPKAGRKRAVAAKAAPPPRVDASGERYARLKAKYDAAQSTTENANHWGNADGLSANAAASPHVRATLRNRARYEKANNGDCKGLIRTIRNDVVGIGPRLQVTVPESWVDPEFGVAMQARPGVAALVERRWSEWCDAVGLFDRLRVMEETAETDGECFLLLVQNDSLAGVQLDVRLVEADQCTTPDLLAYDPQAVDGIRFDGSGNPVEYHFLKRHPGDTHWYNPWDYDAIPAARVIHWYDPDRPGQARGVPSITASLPLYSVLRRYTLAVLGAAETAASIAGVLESDLPPDTGETPPFETMDEVDMPRRGLLTLPGGWKAHGFDGRQPVTGHKEFRGEVLTEAGRAVSAPRNLSTGSSAEYNYSSARLDHLPYRQGVRINRDRMRRVALERVRKAWLAEARLIAGHLPADAPPASLWSWQWHWDGFESIDPVKDAQADDISLRNGTRTLSEVLAERGKDWESHLRQRAREVATARRLERENGLVPGALVPLTPGEQQAAQREEPADAENQAAA